MTKIKIDVRYTPNDQVNVMIVWPQPSAIKGCPLGRGNNRRESIKDLIQRIKMESHIDVEIQDNKMSDDEIISLFYSEHFNNDINDKVDFIINIGTIYNHKRYDLLTMYDSIN